MLAGLAWGGSNLPIACQLTITTTMMLKLDHRDFSFGGVLSAPLLPFLLFPSLASSLLFRSPPTLTHIKQVLLQLVRSDPTVYSFRQWMHATM